MINVRPYDILNSALEFVREGRKVVLVTLCGVVGTSSRAPGCQMVVADDGRYTGSFSGGCIEATIVREALDVLAAGVGRTVRYGSGSPYIDVRLPCGGGIDLVFTPQPDASAIADALLLLDQRKSACLAIGENAIEASGRKPQLFALRIAPSLRILAFGQGDDLIAFATFAKDYGAIVEAITPDGPTSQQLSAASIKTHLIDRRGQLPPVEGDPWTAVVFLFHDHDWEESLLPFALEMRAFYYGAIGSKRTHELRLENLVRQGVDDALIEKLQGRIGLIPATRDPALLALSVLAEVAASYQGIPQGSAGVA